MRSRRRLRPRLDAAFLGSLALAGERAAATLRRLFPAVLLRDAAQGVGELRGVALGHRVLQATAGSLQALRGAVEESQATHAAQGRGVERDGVAAQRPLHYPGADEVVGRLVAQQLAGRLLHAALVQAFQVE